MADRLRLVSLRWPAPPSTIVDLSGIGTSRDSFAIKFGDPASSASAGTTRWGGSRTVAEKRQNASVTLTLLSIGQTPQAALQAVQAALESALPANAPELAIEWRPDGGSYSEFWRLRGPAVYTLNYSWAKFRGANSFPIDITFPVAPTAEGAPYDISDDFSIDTIGLGDWLKDAGTNPLTVSGGSLVPSGTGGTAARYRHARGYPYGDVETIVKISTGATVAGGTWRVCLGMDTAGAETYLALELTSSGSQLVKLVNGSRTVLSTSGSVSAVANTTYFLLLRRAGNVLYWRLSSSWNWTEYTVEPNTYMLTGSDLRLAGAGHVGLSIIAADLAERYDDYSARPFVYRGIRTPEHVQMVGTVVGDVPAMADIEVTPVVGSSTAPAIFGLVAWGERPQVCNLCNVGNLSTVRATGSATYGWSTSTVAGVGTGATSYARAALVAPKYGGSNLQVTCAATTDSGASFKITRRFKRGRMYCAMAWLASSTATTLARIKLGVSGDIIFGPDKALTANWNLHVAQWTPSADTDFAYVAVGIGASTATVFEANGVVVVESPTITTAAAISSTSASTMQVYQTPTDVPYLNGDGTLSQPFLALIDQELIRVWKINGNTWTIDRAVEGSVADTHVVDSIVIVLPTAQPQYEGKGASPAFGIIEGESYAADRQAITPTVGNSDYRAGGYVELTAGTSVDFYLDPSGIPPDDFTQGDMLVEVWARLGFDPNGTGMSVVLSANGSEQYDPTAAASVVAGVPRYTLDYGPAGLMIATPAGTHGTLIPQFFRLGVLPMTVDPAKPQRWRVRLAYARTGGSGDMSVDYLIAMPARARMGTPVGESSSDQFLLTFVPNSIQDHAVTKILRSDGSALLRVPRLGASRQPDAFPDQGLGVPIDMPNTDCDLLVKMSNVVPNDPGAFSPDMFPAEPYWTAMLHVAVTPRFATARGS